MKKKYESQFPTNEMMNDKIEKKTILKNKKKIDLSLSKLSYRWVLKYTSSKRTEHDNFLSSNLSENQTKVDWIKS